MGIFMYSEPIKLNNFLDRKHRRRVIYLKLQQGLTL